MRDAADRDRPGATLLGEDIGRVRKIDDIARSLARSPRALQLDIRVAGHTFTSLVRGTRTREACRLLLETTMTLADVGYWCGYADQAHFQRDFRRAVNMTPGQYRSMERGGTASRHGNDSEAAKNCGSAS